MCAGGGFACVCVHMDNTHAQTFDFLGKSKGNCWPLVRHLSEALNLYGHFLLHAAATVIICQQQFAKLHGSLSNPVIYYSKLHLDRTGMQRTWQRFAEVCHHRNQNMHRIKQNKKCAFCVLVTNVSTSVHVWSGFAGNTFNAICWLDIYAFFILHVGESQIDKRKISHTPHLLINGIMQNEILHVWFSKPQLICCE